MSGELDWILGHVGMAYVWAAWRLCRVEIHMLETPEEILVPLEIPKSEQIGWSWVLLSGLKNIAALYLAFVSAVIGESGLVFHQWTSDSSSRCAWASSWGYNFTPVAVLPQGFYI